MTKGKEGQWETGVKGVSFQMFPDGSDSGAISYLEGEKVKKRDNLAEDTKYGNPFALFWDPNTEDTGFLLISLSTLYCELTIWGSLSNSMVAAISKQPLAILFDMVKGMG